MGEYNFDKCGPISWRIPSDIEENLTFQLATAFGRRHKILSNPVTTQLRASWRPIRELFGKQCCSKSSYCVDGPDV